MCGYTYLISDIEAGLLDLASWCQRTCHVRLRVLASDHIAQGIPLAVECFQEMASQLNHRNLSYHNIWMWLWPRLQTSVIINVALCQGGNCPSSSDCLQSCPCFTY